MQQGILKQGGYTRKSPNACNKLEQLYDGEAERTVRTIKQTKNEDPYILRTTRILIYLYHWKMDALLLSY